MLKKNKKTSLGQFNFVLLFRRKEKGRVCGRDGSGLRLAVMVVMGMLIVLVVMMMVVVVVLWMVVRAQ